MEETAKIITLDQPTAAAMTNYKELVKMYSRKDPKKYEEAISKNKARYRNEMDMLLESSNATH
jgi:hypothetical protein